MQRNYNPQIYMSGYIDSAVRTLFQNLFFFSLSEIAFHKLSSAIARPKLLFYLFFPFENEKKNTQR